MEGVVSISDMTQHHLLHVIDKCLPTLRSRAMSVSVFVFYCNPCPKYISNAPSYDRLDALFTWKSLFITTQILAIVSISSGDTVFCSSHRGGGGANDGKEGG